jgi:hypothetical protein
MKTPTRMMYRQELHGWAKLWARIQRKPWAWNYTVDIEFVPTQRRNDDHFVAVNFRMVGAIRKEVA